MCYTAVVTFLSSFFVISFVRSEENCDLLGRLLYDELKCAPKFIDGRYCPISYDCPEYKLDPNHCTFLGKRYNVTDSVKEGSYCNLGCFCNGNNEFNCAVVDCYHGPITAGCHQEFTLRKCCPDNIEKCPPFDDIPKCEFEEKSYYKGQIIDTGDTCWNCVCQEGFRGVMEEPFCIRRPCDVELRFSQQIAQGCAPIYRKTYKALCCPSSFICPDKVDELIIQTFENKPGDHEQPRCTFGDQKFKIKDGFIAKYKEFSRNETTTCTCRIPPLMSCISEY